MRRGGQRVVFSFHSSIYTYIYAESFILQHGAKLLKLKTDRFTERRTMPAGEVVEARLTEQCFLLASVYMCSHTDKALNKSN